MIRVRWCCVASGSGACWRETTQGLAKGRVTDPFSDVGIQAPTPGGGDHGVSGGGPGFSGRRVGGRDGSRDLQKRAGRRITTTPGSMAVCALTKWGMRLAALTAAPQVEMRPGSWEQFDLEATVWVKPAEATGTAKSHRGSAVPSGAGCGGRGTQSDGGRAGVPRQPSRREDRQGGDEGAAQGWDPASGHGFRSRFKRLGARARRGQAAVGVRAERNVQSSAAAATYARDDGLEKSRRVMQRSADSISGRRSGQT